MNFWSYVFRIISFLQTILGILGNFSLIFYYLVLYYKECTLKPTDLILMNLMTANVMIILSAGVPHTITRFLLRQLLNDFGCRLILYIQRIGRSMSIGTSCLLSVFQAMTISPRESCWKYLKVKAAKYIGCFITLLWVFYVCMHFIFFIYPFIKRNNKSRTRTLDVGQCSIEVHNEIGDSLFTAMVVFPEVLFSLLITWTSSSMIVFLELCPLGITGAIGDGLKDTQQRCGAQGHSSGNSNNPSTVWDRKKIPKAKSLESILEMPWITGFLPQKDYEFIGHTLTINNQD